MKITSAEFITSATQPAHYPPAAIPEIAFAGRSNVGKSSLINTLLNRKHLVKTSSTPGRTQLINFFDINQRLRFVDLPGYGYAKVPVAVRMKWGPMIETYLSGRETLKGVVVIMDIRRIPGQAEHNLLGWLNHYAITGVLVLTKTDKLSKNKQAQQHRLIAAAIERPKNDFIPFSAKTRRGRDALWNAILSLVDNTDSRNAH
ncbi:MAG: ribosome biogenesis GTP-binding protein YihA/YsxC [Desulfobacterales bacterium]|jgi:GTP-binding protein